LDAALDVFDVEPLPPDSPFRGLPNVLLMPHQAAATVECYFEMGAITATEIERHATGQPLQYELTEAALSRMG
jgi:phosphoglycerate dehydrogenase-like enzyme